VIVAFTTLNLVKSTLPLQICKHSHTKFYKNLADGLVAGTGTSLEGRVHEQLFLTAYRTRKMRKRLVL
jgi:hypothetical protein